jgi:hypothetical protein
VFSFVDSDFFSTDDPPQGCTISVLGMGVMNGRRGEIEDLEAYLLGSFYHRLGRALKKEEGREEMIHLVPSALELEVLAKTSHAE